MAKQERVKIGGSRVDAPKAEPIDSQAARQVGTYPVQPNPMDAQQIRRVFYSVHKMGRGVDESAAFTRDLQRELTTMPSSFQPGSEEYMRYYELRRGGMARAEAFDKVHDEFDMQMQNPNKAPRAREIQEGRQFHELPGGRQSFHTSGEVEEPTEDAEQQKQKSRTNRQTISEQKQDQGSGSSSAGSSGSDTEIPDDWKTKPAAEVRALAESISGDSVNNREEAEEVIEAELERREAEE